MVTAARDLTPRVGQSNHDAFMKRSEIDEWTGDRLAEDDAAEDVADGAVDEDGTIEYRARQCSHRLSSCSHAAWGPDSSTIDALASGGCSPNSGATLDSGLVIF